MTYTTLSDGVGYVAGGTNIGIIRIDDKRVMLVDSGLNDTTARKVLRAVRDELDSEVVAILNTHGHADHFGANAFVQKRTGCEIWAPHIEAATIAHPILQPALLYGGADPVDALRTRFLLADASNVTAYLSPGLQTIHGVEVELVPLGGHSPNQLGILVDRVFFCADVVFPEVAIEKYRIPYLYSLTEHLTSLEHALGVGGDTVVPGHGPIYSQIAEPVAFNRSAIGQAMTAIVDCLDEPATGDDVCTSVFRALDVPILDAQGYFLLRPTINAYLAHLDRIGEVQLEIVDRVALWSRR